MACECDSMQIEQLKVQIRQHELTIVQLLEMTAHTNRLVSELTWKQKQRTSQDMVRSFPSLSNK